MAEPFQIEPLGDHAYLVRGSERGECIESRFRVAPYLLDELGVAEADEARVVAATAAVLAERQPIVDLPPLVDIEDVAARYEDYMPDVAHRLGH